MASNSSKKSTQGEAALALANKLRTEASVCPKYCDKISVERMDTKFMFACKTELEFTIKQSISASNTNLSRNHACQQALAAACRSMQHDALGTGEELRQCGP
jgi:hypothetical protein